jgi:hypothetical protein
MKTVISFDVGMKNLAYCLFQIGDCNSSNSSNSSDNSLTDYKVIRWEVINLCTPIVQKCTNGGLQGCIEVAKYCKTFKNDDQTSSDENENEESVIIDYYCSKHARKCKFKIPPSELDIKKVKSKKLVDIKSIIEKYNIVSIFDKSHEAQTSQTYNDPQELIVITKRQKNNKEQLIDMIQNELDNNYLENIENIRADQIDLLTLGRNMMTELDKFISPYTSTSISTSISTPENVRDATDSRDLGKMGGLEKYKIDIVIIENQISTIASRMKTLQGMIAQYFIMRGTPCIEFISAANKLKMFMTKKKTTYTERKIESVEVTKDLLEKLPQFEKYRGCLEKNKKKDDLADCFLQGIYYLTLKKMIDIEL